jgi:KDO2-lipid IV(A) lauroyltransferase
MALYLVIQIGAFLSRIIPRPWRYRIAAAVGHAVFLLWAEKRRITVLNMATVLGRDPRDPEVRRAALQSMRNYCKYLVEFLELPILDPADHFITSMKIQGLEHLEGALARGKGVILASAHLGTIELGGLRLSHFTDYHAVYDTFRPAYLDRLIQNKRRDKGIQLISVSNIREMLRVLQAGGTMALLFDRPVSRDKGVPVRFFGQETAIPGGPAVLTLKTGATLLPVYLFRNPDLSFEVRIFPPITWAPSDDREADIRGITQKLMDTLQTVVRSRPDQWYMFRPMWPQASGPVSAGRQEMAAGDWTG